MKQLFEIWRDYLGEQEEIEIPYQIYCDLDGVLVNFEKGAMDLINEDLKNPENIAELSDNLKKKYSKMVAKLEELERDLTIEVEDFSMNKEVREQRGVGSTVRNYMYPRLQNNLEFWSNLEWMPDGKQLWSHISNIKPSPIILTAPMKSDPEGGDHKGKRLWVEKNIGNVVEVIVERDKWKYAVQESGGQNILIDDTYRKIEPWGEKGGIGFLHKTAADTIASLSYLVASVLERDNKS